MVNIYYVEYMHRPKVLFYGHFLISGLAVVICISRECNLTRVQPYTAGVQPYTDGCERLRTLMMKKTTL